MTQRNIPLSTFFTPISGNVTVNLNKNAIYYFSTGYGSLSIVYEGKTYSGWSDPGNEPWSSTYNTRFRYHTPRNGNDWLYSMSGRYITYDNGVLSNEIMDLATRFTTYTNKYVHSYIQNDKFLINGAGLGLNRSSITSITFTNVAAGSYVATDANLDHFYNNLGLDFTKSPDIQ